MYLSRWISTAYVYGYVCMCVFVTHWEGAWESSKIESIGRQSMTEGRVSFSAMPKEEGREGVSGALIFSPPPLPCMSALFELICSFIHQFIQMREQASQWVCGGAYINNNAE